MKSGDAQRNVQKNTTDNMNWRDTNGNIYNIYRKENTSRNEKISAHTHTGHKNKQAERHWHRTALA